MATAITAGRHRTDKPARRTRRDRLTGQRKMSDILADYREWRDAQPGAIKTHSDRCHMWHRDCMIHRLADALGRARLTDAEREAVAYYVGTGGPDAVDATLRGLLERTK